VDPGEPQTTPLPATGTPPTPRGPPPRRRSFDRERDIPGFPALAWACADFHACRWEGVRGDPPPGDFALGRGSRALADYVDSLNGDAAPLVREARERGRAVITMSHFLPSQALLPEKRFLT